MFPAVYMDSIDLAAANQLLRDWSHKMGPVKRANYGGLQCHVLYVHGEPVAVAVTCPLIRETVAGLAFTHRGNTIELARLCACVSWANRVMLRLWREVVFPAAGKQYAISYQDADLHTGNTYRFDGWKRVSYSRSGTDQRTGRKGRNKWVWLWERAA